jgi:hypothetical protein
MKKVLISMMFLLFCGNVFSQKITNSETISLFFWAVPIGSDSLDSEDADTEEIKDVGVFEDRLPRYQHISSAKSDSLVFTAIMFTSLGSPVFVFLTNTQYAHLDKSLSNVSSSISNLKGLEYKAVFVKIDKKKPVVDDEQKQIAGDDWEKIRYVLISEEPKVVAGFIKHNKILPLSLKN